MKFFTKYDRPVSEPVSCDPDLGVTRQEFLADCDVNRIIKSYQSFDALPQGSRVPMFEDFSNVPTYDQAFAFVEAARVSFEGLPAEVRLRFHNDPSELYAFVHDESNREEAEKLGLVTKKIQPEPAVPVTPVSDQA